jgi:hypothetical protein
MTWSTGGRLAGEALLWLPTAFTSATWADEAGPATATWRIGDQDETVTVRIDQRGRLVEFSMQRWGNPDGGDYGRYPFGGVVESERTFDGGRSHRGSVPAGGGVPTGRTRASSSSARSLRRRSADSTVQLSHDSSCPDVTTAVNVRSPAAT